MQTFGIGLAGMGNVGAGVYKHLTQNRALLRERLGTVLRQVLEDTCADIPHSSESDSEGLHAKGRGLSRPFFGV